jgi:hypothetical protein
LFKLVGKPIFTHDAHRIIRNLERLETNAGQRPNDLRHDAAGA